MGYRRPRISWCLVLTPEGGALHTGWNLLLHILLISLQTFDYNQATSNDYTRLHDMYLLHQIFNCYTRPLITVSPYCTRHISAPILTTRNDQHTPNLCPEHNRQHSCWHIYCGCEGTIVVFVLPLLKCNFV